MIQSLTESRVVLLKSINQEAAVAGLRVAVVPSTPEDQLLCCKLGLVVRGSERHSKHTE